MEIIIIAALGREKQLGLKGQVPWYLPEDFKHFKKTTLGHPIIMGRKTYESLGKPLPKRRNLVISKTLGLVEGVEVYPTLKSSIDAEKKRGTQKIFICGGRGIYQESFTYATRMILSYVDYEEEADVYFPAFSEGDWLEVSRAPQPLVDSSLSWSIVTYQRKHKK